MALLSQRDKEYLLSVKSDQVDRAFIEKNLVAHFNKTTRKVIPPRWSWQDEFSLKKGEYTNTENVARTNVGMFIFNKIVLEETVAKVIGYWNTTMTAGALEELENQIYVALLEDKLTVEDFAGYEDRLQWMISLHTVVCSSFTQKTSAPLPKVMAMKEKLFKQHKDEIERGDVIVGAKIEKELLDVAKKELKGDHGMELFDSGARGNFGNNYKAINVMKGPMIDPITGKFQVVKSSFNEGLSKDDIPIFGSSVVAGQYPKSVGTQVGGYTVKRFQAMFQGVQLDERGSDCHSKGTLDVTITKKNKQDYLYRYIVEGGKLVLLNRSNIDRYIGKLVHMRSPLYCTSAKKCNMCYGDKPYMVGIRNVGLTFGLIGSKFINLSMKAFHDSSIKLNKINVEDILL